MSVKISGAVIVRNGVQLGYPFVESIKSVLPLCAEVLVGVGDSEDDTREKVEEINSPKIKIIDSKWDMGMRSGGQVLSQETNKILKQCGGDWIFYIQADEVASEKDFEKIESAIAYANDKNEIEGLVFDYLHFYGSYFTVQTGRNWYRREVRIIRNGKGISSYGDAQGFRKDGKKIRAILSGAKIYHYGWARPLQVMMEKIKSFHQFWHNDEWIKENCSSKNLQDYFCDLGNLVEFMGGHPKVMEGLINHESEGFIKECRAQYLIKRSIKQSISDYLRKFSIGQNKNFRGGILSLW